MRKLGHRTTSTLLAACSGRGLSSLLHNPFHRMQTTSYQEPIVYLGPSLPREEAEGLIQADFRPPVRRGDLATIEAGRTVVILDGEFDQSFPVSPKEILRLLDAGSTVMGAASMCALR